jgi:hypothetical protein
LTMNGKKNKIKSQWTGGNDQLESHTDTLDLIRDLGQEAKWKLWPTSTAEAQDRNFRQESSPLRNSMANRTQDLLAGFRGFSSSNLDGVPCSILRCAMFQIHSIAWYVQCYINCPHVVSPASFNDQLSSISAEMRKDSSDRQ